MEPKDLVIGEVYFATETFELSADPDEPGGHYSHWRPIEKGEQFLYMGKSQAYPDGPYLAFLWGNTRIRVFYVENAQATSPRSFFAKIDSIDKCPTTT